VENDVRLKGILHRLGARLSVLCEAKTCLHPAESIMPPALIKGLVRGPVRSTQERFVAGTLVICVENLGASHLAGGETDPVRGFETSRANQGSSIHDAHTFGVSPGEFTRSQLQYNGTAPLGNIEKSKLIVWSAYDAFVHINARFKWVGYHAMWGSVCTTGSIHPSTPLRTRAFFFSGKFPRLEA